MHYRICYLLDFDLKIRSGQVCDCKELMEDFLKEVRYSVVSLIEKFLTTASLQLDNFLETSGLLHDNNLAITLQKRQRIVFHSKLLRDR